MKKKESKDTRYVLDIDLKTKKIINWDYNDKKCTGKTGISESFFP